MIKPQIKLLEEKKLVGINLSMSLVQNRTGELWKSFMPRLPEIKNRINKDLISLQVYDPDYFKSFSPEKTFTKWALAEVKDAVDTPEGMESFILESGEYAIFHYKGSSADNSIFHHIFGQWLPNSNYDMDNRPHFEVLGGKYKNNDPGSEEEIWIPIKQKLQNVR